MASTSSTTTAAPISSGAPASTNAGSSTSSTSSPAKALGAASKRASKATRDSPLMPLILVGAGAYLVWFGTHYWRDQQTVWPSDPVKALLQGKPLPTPQPETPQTLALSAIETTAAQQAASTTGTGTGSGSGSGSGSGGVTPASGSEDAWITAFLASIGAPATTANRASLTAWIQHETPWPPVAANNPLNTTQPAPGATDYNSVGVKNYPSAAEGMGATKATIENGLYNDVLMALRGGNGLCGRSWAGLSKWSGGGYSSVC